MFYEKNEKNSYWDNRKYYLACTFLISVRVPTETSAFLNIFIIRRSIVLLNVASMD